MPKFFIILTDIHKRTGIAYKVQFFLYFKLPNIKFVYHS